jgi:hypothetical protein
MRLRKPLAGCVFLVVLIGSSQLSGLQSFPPQTSIDWRPAVIRELTFTDDSVMRIRGFSSSDQSVLISMIARLLAAGSEGMLSSAEARRLALQSRARLVDLSLANKPTLVVQATGADAGCGATGNCPMWVIAKNGHAFSILLETQAQTFAVQKASSKGYRNVVFGWHSSATESGLSMYRFDGTAYGIVGCYLAITGNVSSGSKSTEITTVPCEPRN